MDPQAMAKSTPTATTVLVPRPALEPPPPPPSPHLPTELVEDILVHVPLRHPINSITNANVDTIHSECAAAFVAVRPSPMFYKVFVPRLQPYAWTTDAWFHAVTHAVEAYHVADPPVRITKDLLKLLAATTSQHMAQPATEACAVDMALGVVAYCDLLETQPDDDVPFELVLDVSRAIPLPRATKVLMGKVVAAARALAPVLAPMPLEHIVPLAVEGVSLSAMYPWATNVWIVAVVRAAEAMPGNDAEVDASTLRRYAEVTAGHFAQYVPADQQELDAVAVAVSVVAYDEVVRVGHQVQLLHVIEFVRVWHEELGMPVTKEAAIEGLSVLSSGV